MWSSDATFVTDFITTLNNQDSHILLPFKYYYNIIIDVIVFTLILVEPYVNINIEQSKGCVLFFQCSSSFWN